jgi:cytochrome oxidase assembly protein ShyY1
VGLRPRPAATIAVVLGLALFCGLGTWQLRRREEARLERERWAARIAEAPFDAASPPADPDLRRARVTGTPDWDAAMLVVGRWVRNEPGYGLLVPVDVGSGWVLVDLGWIPGDRVDEILAAERDLPAPRTWEGLARTAAEDPRAAEGLPTEADGRQWYWRRPSPQTMLPGRQVAPFVVADGPGLGEEEASPDREPPVAGWIAEPHQRPHGEYAATWFGIAGALILFWVYGSMPEQGPARRSA